MNWIQLPLPNYANINLHYQNNKIPHLNSEHLSELKNSESEVSLKQFLKKDPSYRGNDLQWRLI